MRFRDHLDDSDNALFVHGVIEKAEIALLHRDHVELCGMVSYTIPFFALCTFPNLVAPGPGSRFAFKKPISHCPNVRLLSP